MKILRLFLTDPVLESIVEQTMLLAIQKGNESFDVSKEEVCLYWDQWCYKNYLSVKSA